MKNLILLAALTLGLFACNDEKMTILPVTTTLTYHDLIACGGGDWERADETGEEWASRVEILTANAGITIINSTYEFVTPEPIDGGIIGDNCQPTGDRLRVEVPFDDEADLRALGYY